MEVDTEAQVNLSEQLRRAAPPAGLFFLSAHYKKRLQRFHLPQDAQGTGRKPVSGSQLKHRTGLELRGPFREPVDVTAGG